MYWEMKMGRQIQSWKALFQMWRLEHPTLPVVTGAPALNWVAYRCHLLNLKNGMEFHLRHSWIPFAPPLRAFPEPLFRLPRRQVARQLSRLSTLKYQVKTLMYSQKRR